MSTDRTIRAVRLDADGTLTDIDLPLGAGLSKELRRLVDGWVEVAHYARADGSRRLSVALDSDGALTKPENPYAASLVNAIRLQQLPYSLYGTAVLLGALDDGGQHTDVPEDLHQVLPQVIAALKARYTPAAS
ncbi:hypothetical protein [Streptomyces sp. NPDC026673]|uniref:hypothetical protein n=1 Tax=Streptomyces sp. NPDC026673 TaxID=3155724 RepID=UPI0033F468C5